MSFAKNVTKYQKWVLGSIVGVIALSLVVSFGNLNLDGGKDEKPFATIFLTVTVTEREWDEARAKAYAWYRLKVVREIDDGEDFNSQRIQPYLFSYQEGPGLLLRLDDFKPSNEDQLASARELIVLGHDAKAKQVRASDEEVDAVIRGFLERGRVAQDDVDAQVLFSRRYFLAEPESFRAAVRDFIMAEKALNLDTAGCNTRYEDLYQQKLSSSRSVRVLVAGIDGTKLPGDLVPVTDDAIRARFEQERESYKMPPKVQLEYLMAAFDDFKSRIKDPTPEEIQKYYEEKRKEFLKPLAALEEGHHAGDGHDHEAQKEEVKPLAEVREEIIKKIKDKRASDEAYATIKQVSSKDFAERWYKLFNEEKEKDPKDPKAARERAQARTGPVLAELREAYKARGIELRNGATLAFDKNEREPFDAELGKQKGASDPMEWAFQGPVGEVGNQVYHSDKGYALLRIARKIEGYPSDLTGPIRAKIRQDLVRDAAGERARDFAVELVKRIREKGAAEVARLKMRSDLAIQRSTYVTPSTSDADTGLKPPALAQQVKSLVQKLPADLPPGGIEAHSIDGNLMGDNRKDWSYVVVVEDAVQIAPEVKDEDFLQEVRRAEMQELTKARANRARELVKYAEWKDAKEAPPAE